MNRREVTAAVCVVAFVAVSVEAFAPYSSLVSRYGTKTGGVFGAVPKLSYVVNDDIRAFYNRIDGSPLFSQPTDNDEGDSSGAVTATLLKGEEENLSSKETPVTSRVQALRAQAQQARLEAERLDTQLTMEKIERLNVELEKANAKGKSTEELSEQIENLQRKLRGEPPISVPPPARANSTLVETEMGTAKSAAALGRGIDMSIKPFDQQLYNNIEDAIAELKKDDRLLELRIMAMTVGIVDKEINTTDVAIRTEMASRGDFSFFTNVPTEIDFDEDEIEAAKEALSVLDSGFMNMFTEDILDIDTAYMDDELKAKIMLAEEFYLDYLNVEMDQEALDDEISPIMTQCNYEDQFPDCIDKEGKTPKEDEANAVLRILPAAGFTPTSKPLKVNGGYIIPGERKEADRNLLVDALDKQVARNDELQGKVTLCLVEDLNEIEMTDIETLEDVEELLATREAIYVLGPDIGRDPQTVLKSSSTVLGLVAAWCLSLYPTLLHTNIAQEFSDPTQLPSLLTNVDLSMLSGTDVSRPIFAVFMACLLAHELAHGVVGGIYNLETSFPTFVPSLTTGITSTVTSFKAPPKNREQLFDFAFAGPMVGMLASFAALVIGCLLTEDGYTSGAELPLDILRQSTLGGAVIEWFFGSGTLAIPAGAEEQMASMALGLHPVAIAGFMGLLVNALAMLPVGITDGGRIAETIFGRSAKALVGVITLVGLLGSGVFGGNHLLAFYGFFCVACQVGMELPLRNDLDEISFPRVLAAISGFLVALLVLFPMQ